MNPFAVLGVSPSATDTQIRDAYLRRSKELHPDRFADATPEEQEAATRAMQEVNAAYFDLRRRKPGEARVNPASAESATTAPAAPVWPPVRKRRVRWPIVLVAGLVLSAAGAMLVGAGGPQHVKSNNPSKPVDLRRLQGECLTYNDDGQLDDVIDCTRPHAARVMKVVDHGTPCPVWTDQSIQTQTYDLCLDTHQ